MSVHRRQSGTAYHPLRRRSSAFDGIRSGDGGGGGFLEPVVALPASSVRRLISASRVRASGVLSVAHGLGGVRARAMIRACGVPK